MSARLKSPSDGVLIRPMTLASLDGVVDLEASVYPFPWTRGNFVDSLAASYVALTLNGVAGELIGYCVAMRGADEMHLLNITVAPAQRGGGHARRLFAELVRLGLREGARRLWLEVRESNAEARAIYLRLGFLPVGVRRGYYPAPGGREDALVMSFDLESGPADALD